MRLIIAGGRTFTNLPLMTKKLDHLIHKTDEPIIVISGTARGADQTGEAYAALRGYEVERYPARWDLYGRSAGYKRNAQMAGIATHCVVFWDGKSRGSKHMIDLATKQGLELRVVMYDDEIKGNVSECEHCLPPSECIHCNPAYRNAYTAHCSACHPEPGTTAQTWHAADGTCLKCNPNYGNT